MPDLTRYNPFQEMISLREAMDRLFEESFISPRTILSRGVASNLYETKDDFILQIPMPGVKPEEVEITAQQDTVSVKWRPGLLRLRMPPCTGATSARGSISSRSRYLRPSIPIEPKPAIRMVS